jgi:flagellar M-ring protein FliF
MKRLLGSLSIGQRISILVVIAALAGGLYYLIQWRRESDFRLLYSEMDAADAASVVERLKQSAIPYRLSADGRAVMVPSARVAETRLELASAGLPRNGRMGFELFDKTNFGATEFAEQINYRRALEGELERSVGSLAAVEQARVHLTFPKDSVFLEARQPAKASVMVKLRPGARLTAANVSAVTHLVASAVQGLAPEAVSVLDMQGNLLNRPRRAAEAGQEPPSEATLEFRQAVERDLVAKIATTLEPVVGADKFRASATVDCDFTSGEQSEESYDPARSVMLTSQKTEETSGAPATAGVPGTASNLPRPTSQPAASATAVARSTESITYQSSRTVKRVKLPQGTIRRMSIAVLVDHTRRWAGDGKAAKLVVEPLPPEKLKVIHDLAAAAVGLNPERGDQIIVESLPFDTGEGPEPPPASPPPAPGARRIPLPGWLEKMGGERMLVWGGVGLGAVVALLAGLALVARRKTKPRRAAVAGPAQLPAGQPARAAAAGAAAAQPLEEAPAALPELPAPPPKKTDLIAARLKDAIKKDPAGSAQILRGWMSDEQKIG